MAITIHEVRLPTDVERGAEFAPMFNTSIVELDGGAEQANINWTYPRFSGDISYGIQSITLLNTAIAFFYARRGRAYGFRFKDWADFTITDGTIGTGDGATAAFQIVKVYSDSVLPFSRKITRPITAGLVVKVDGVTKTLTTHYTVSATTGIVTFTMGNIPTLAQVITVTCEFDVPVRFDTDRIPLIVEHAAGTGAAQIGKFPIIEVRE